MRAQVTSRVPHAHARILAVAGDPVAHSLSPAMHNAAIAALGLDAVYVAARTTPRAFPGLVHALLSAGGALNVTVPFKAQAAGLVDHPTDAVRRTGACNTIWGDADAPHGDNTDIFGVRYAAAELLDALVARTARIYGTGGSARAAAVGLTEEYAGIEIAVVSREPERAQAFVRWAGEAGVRCRVAGPTWREPVDIAVNCTPLTADLPARAEDEPNDPERDPARPGAFLDLNYRPGGTAIVRCFRLIGVPAMDGRLMLVAQGAAAFEHFFGVQPPVEVMRAAVEDALGP